MRGSALRRESLSATAIREHFGRCHTTEPSPPRSTELTPSTRYVIREARKRLGDLSAPAPSEQELLSLVRDVEHTEAESLSERERTMAVAALAQSLEHFDILSPLLEQKDVNDIIVRSYRDISIQVGRRNIQTDLHFPDRDTYRSFVENLLKRAGKSCTTATPVVDASLDQRIRICVTHESLSPGDDGPMMTIRIAQHVMLSLESLVARGLASANVLEYLAALVRSGAITILVAGEVGTGKTTLVKALLSQIPEDEAVLAIEDTHEITLDRRFVRTIITREANTEGTGRIAPALAIRTGMRMAMNRIVLGEMRDAEAAEAFVDVCSSGHAGMSTIHARSARDALSRLELFLARAQGNIGIDPIRRQIANAVSVVVYLGLDREEKVRRVLEVVEVGAASDGIVQVSPIYLFQKGAWVRSAGVTSYSSLLRENGGPAL